MPISTSGLLKLANGYRDAFYGDPMAGLSGVGGF